MRNYNNRFIIFSLFLVFVLPLTSQNIHFEHDNLEYFSYDLSNWEKKTCIPWNPGSNLPNPFYGGYISTVPGLSGIILKENGTVDLFCIDGIGCPLLHGHWIVPTDRKTIIITYTNDEPYITCMQLVAESVPYCENNCSEKYKKGISECLEIKKSETKIETFFVAPSSKGLIWSGKYKPFSWPKNRKPKCIHKL